MVLNWFRIMLSPTVVGGFVGFMIYVSFPNRIGLIFGLLFLFTGLILGIIWATKVWKSKGGTISFMSKLYRNTELDSENVELVINDRFHTLKYMKEHILECRNDKSIFIINNTSLQKAECAICCKIILPEGNTFVTYSNDNHIVCSDCYTKYIISDDFMIDFKKLETLLLNTK